jgi:MFS family permease
MSTQSAAAASASGAAPSQPHAEAHAGHETGYGSRAYRTYVLGALLLVYILNFVDRGLLSVVGPKLKADIGITDTWWGLLTGAAFAVLYTIVGLPLARLAERAHRVWIMAICLVIWSGFTALCGLSREIQIGSWTISAFSVLVACRFGVGIGEAGCTPQSTSLIADYYPRKWRATAMGFYGMGVTLGTTLANLVGGPITDHFGWREAFVILGLPGIVVAIVLKLTVKEPPRGYSDPVNAAAPVERASWAETFKVLFNRPSYWWMVAATTIAAFCGYAIANFQSLYITRTFHLTAGNAALYVTAPSYFAGAVGTFLLGWLAQKIGARSTSAIAWLPAIGMAICVPFYLAAFSTTGLLICTVFLALGNFSKYGYLAAQYTIATGVVSTRMRATSTAILVFMQNMLGYTFGPPFAGMVSDFFFGRALDKANLNGVVSRQMCDAAQSAMGLASAAAKRAGQAVDAGAVLSGLKQPVSDAQFAFCNAANSESTQTAMLSLSLIYGVGAVCFVFCMLTLKRDMTRQDAAA